MKKTNSARSNPMSRIREKIVGSLGRTLAVALAIATTAVLGIGSSANAWGPNRQTFTEAVPASYVTFNSITDDKSWGDERGFVKIKDITGSENNGTTATSGGFSDTAKYVSGHEYMIKMFVHNNAAENLNLVAKNVRAKAYVQSASGNKAEIQGMISADNCGANNNGNAGSSTNCTFWDEAYITGSDSDNFKIAYVDGSGRYYNGVKSWDTSGFTLGNNIPSEQGELLGYQQMDGNIPGCFDYSGYVTFIVRATSTNETSFTLTKQARVKTTGDTNQWSYGVTAKPGDTIQYRIEYTNTSKAGTPDQKAIARDYMDAGLSYVSGSTYLQNANYSEAPGHNVEDDSWITNGLNLGTYAGGSQANAILKYEVTVPTEDKLQCGDNVFENVIIVAAANADGSNGGSGSKLATNKVTVHKDCADTPGNPTVPPVTTEKCKWNDKLEAGDPNCLAPSSDTTPGAPLAGSSIVTPILSLAGFLLLASVAIILILRKNPKLIRHNKE